MYQVRNPKVSIHGLPKDRQTKVRKIRGRLKKGSYTTSNKIVDDKTVSEVLKAINR